MADFHLQGWDRWTGHRGTGPPGSTEGLSPSYDPRLGFVGQQEVRIQLTQVMMMVTTS